MSRLIDADALKNYIKLFNIGCGCYEDYQKSFLNAIDAQPTIEPQRKTGKWIEQDDGWDGVYYECSCCKEAFTLIDGTPSDNLYNYCPNCGSDMRTG